MGLRDEIAEQPAVVGRVVADAGGRIAEVGRRIREHGAQLAFLAARGSSDNAGLYAKYLWGAHNRIPVALAAPSLFSVYGTPPAIQDALVVAISQSGQSPDIVSVVQEGRRQGALTLAITNEPDSPLAAAAELVIETHAGPELAVAATKTYSAQLAAIAALSAAIAGDLERSGWLRRLPALLERMLDVEEEVAAAAVRFRALDRCAVLGRGFNFATAFEWALKLKELAGVVAEPYSTADFEHGPVALAGSGFPLFAVVPSGAIGASVTPLLERLVRERGVDVLAVSNDPAALALAAVGIALPADLPEWLSPIPAIVPAQLFSYHLTRAKGLDPETPRGLSKVTRTT